MCIDGFRYEAIVLEYFTISPYPYTSTSEEWNVPQFFGGGIIPRFLLGLTDISPLAFDNSRKILIYQILDPVGYLRG